MCGYYVRILRDSELIYLYYHELTEKEKDNFALSNSQDDLLAWGIAKYYAKLYKKEYDE